MVREGIKDVNQQAGTQILKTRRRQMAEGILDSRDKEQTKCSNNAATCSSKKTSKQNKES